jgi:hypothetical protein
VKLIDPEGAGPVASLQADSRTAGSNKKQSGDERIVILEGKASVRVLSCMALKLFTGGRGTIRHLT